MEISWFWLSNGSLDSSTHQSTGAGISQMAFLFLSGTWAEKTLMARANKAFLSPCSLSTWPAWGREVGLLTGAWLFPEEVFKEIKAEDSRVLRTLQVTLYHFYLHSQGQLIIYVRRSEYQELWFKKGILIAQTSFHIPKEIKIQVKQVIELSVNKVVYVCTW